MAAKTSFLKPISTITILLWGAFVTWVGTVCVLSSLSASTLSFFPHPFSGFDKVVHGLLFFVGGALLTAAIRKTVCVSWTIILIVSITTLSAFGCGDEIHQLFTVGRSGGDLGDWLANFTGVIMGSSVAWLVMCFLEFLPIINASLTMQFSDNSK